MIEEEKHKTEGRNETKQQDRKENQAIRQESKPRNTDKKTK